MGFVEETGAAQYLRDVRVTAIYEGTNGIQAMDLVGRKMMDGGEAAFRLIEEIQAGAEVGARHAADLAEAVWEAAETLREATEWLVATATQDRFAGAVPYLAPSPASSAGTPTCAPPAARAATGPRAALAAFYISRLLPEFTGLPRPGARRRRGPVAISPDDLAA